MRDDRVYLEHIMLAIKKIEDYSKGVDKSRFLNESLIQDGVIRQIEIIGEASKLISEESKRRSKIVQWKDMAGMRNKLIHAYFGVDLDAVWKTMKDDIPVLKQQISKLLGEYRS